MRDFEAMLIFVVLMLESTSDWNSWVRAIDDYLMFNNLNTALDYRLTDLLT